MKLSRTLTVAAAIVALVVIGTFVVLQLGGSDDSDAVVATHECEVTIQFNTAVTQADITWRISSFRLRTSLYHSRNSEYPTLSRRTVVGALS